MTRAGLQRLVLWLALAGMVLALHLWIQKSRDFDQGCLGLQKPVALAAETDGGCREVSELPASHLLGVSNAAWGYAFYFTLAVLALAQLVVGPGWARRLHRLGEGLVAGAFLYSCYLVYQMAFVARAWCVLCSLSAALVTGLLLVHVLLRRKPASAPPTEPERAGEFRAALVAVFVAAGVLVGVLLFVDRLGTRPLDQGNTRREIEQLARGTLAQVIDAKKLREMLACRFETDAPRLDTGRLLPAALPFSGEGREVEVLVFYDPNCPHCRVYHAVFRRVMEKYRERARFAVVPVALWDASLPQIAALSLAETSGKYLELWQAMFDQPAGPRKGLDVAQIARLFRDLGLDATNLEARLAAQRPQVEAARARWRAAGVTGAPTVFINGRKVWPANRSEDCLGTLIEQTATRSADGADRKTR